MVNTRDGAGCEAESPRGLTRRGFITAIGTSSLVLGAGAAAGQAFAAAAPSTGATESTGATVSTGGALEVVRGGLRRFSRPIIQPGYQLRLPSGLAAMPARTHIGSERRMAAADGSRAWPVVPAARGGVADLSVAPALGTPSETVYLTGFRDGWYEIVDDHGDVVARTEWDAQAFPCLHVWQEWGASKGYPFWGRFYALGLEPFSEYVLSA
jgi:hypothetical protein